MTRFHQFLAMLLLAVWLPMTSHCYIEEAGLLNITFDQCCDEEAATAPVEGDPCDTGCKMVEKAGYKFQDDDHTLLVPAVICLLQQSPSIPLPISNASIEVTRWPPQTLRLAQFDARTAVPTRAPSFLS